MHFFVGLIKINKLENYELFESGKIIGKIKEVQRTCNLIFWHDNLVLSSHTHILITVVCQYDAAVF